MTTRPTLDTTPEDASLSQWTKDVERFVENLIGNSRLPSAPAQVKVVSQSNSVKVTFRAVNEVGVSEYNIYRSTDKNFQGGNAELIATVTQAINPTGTDIIYTDVEAVEKSFYFVSAVKGLRRPRLEGPVAGFGSSVSGKAIGEDSGGGGFASDFNGISGSILFANEDGLIDQDNDNFFYSQSFKAMIVGNAGLMWGPHNAPDVALVRDEAADTLALKRGLNSQDFRVYETASGASVGSVTQTLLLAEIDTVDRTVYTTSSISPTPDKLILCFITGTDFTFSGPILVTSVTGAGLTWEEVEELPMDTIAGPRQVFACFRALGPGATPGALTITFDGSCALGQWIIVEFDNIDTSGTNGSGAIVQSATNRSDSASTLAATLAAFGSSANATVGGFGCGAGGTPTWTPGAGFTEIAESTGSDRVSMVQFRNDPDTSVGATLDTTSDIAVIALEIKSATPGGNTFLDLKALGVSNRFEVLVDDGTGSVRDLAIGTRALGGELHLVTGGVIAATVGTDQNSAFFGNVLLQVDDLGNDVPGRKLTIERNTNLAVGTVGPAPGIWEMEQADGTSIFFWVDDNGDLRRHTAPATGNTGAPTVHANTDGFKIVEHHNQHYHFVSPGGGSGVFYLAGFYDAPVADSNLTQASPTQTLGTANSPYSAHAFIVAAAAGAASGGSGLVEIEVSGTSIEEDGTRTTSDTEVIVADITAMATDQYFETEKHWIGQITFTLQVAGGGTHTTFNADFNYGLARLEHQSDHDFEVQLFDITGRAGANDSSFNVELLKHDTSGWTYHATAFVPGSVVLVDIASILSTESDLVNGEHFSFIKNPMTEQINSNSAHEGYIVRVTTGANNSVETMNVTVGIAFN